MKLATLRDTTPDGRLAVLSRDLSRAAFAGEVAGTLQAALENWDIVAPALERLAAEIEAGTAAASFAFDASQALAPLPRAWQWLDGSAFLSHGLLMQKAYDLPPIESDLPLMYQGMSHRFLAPGEDVALPSEADGIDFEGEFGILTDQVPMGVTPAASLGHIKLAVVINDWSLRAIAPAEMKTGFGWVRAKPACSMAPIAVTMDELSPCWRDGRVHAALAVAWNHAPFGRADGGEMAFGFHELIAHAAATRALCAGTVIGSGTVSNADHRKAGSSCIAERRAIEMIEAGSAKTPFMSFGDTVRMEVTDSSGQSVFGAIDQRVIRAKSN